MGIFSTLFTKEKNQSKTDKPATAPGTNITYDANLITRFKGHHQSMLDLYGESLQAAKEENFPLLARKLKLFQSVLEHHVLEENLRFYVYLSRCLDDEDHRQMVMDMKKEMNDISRSVRTFIKYHLEHDIDKDSISKIRLDLKEVGVILKDRIEREENSLYTLYLPPAQY